MTRSVLRLAAGALAVALSIWLMPASVHIVGWTPSGPVRVAMVGGMRSLAFAVVGAALAAAIALLAVRRNDDAVKRLGEAGAMLTLLSIWVVPYLPWLPDRAPLLLLFAGPLRWIVAAAVVGGALWIGAGRPVIAGPRLRSPGRIRTAVAVISFAVYAVLGLRFSSILELSGDEPHYLVITHSLLVDRDLDIANNHAQRDYRAFYPGELRPDYLRRGVHGEIYSIHAPGLPALLLPGYAVAGARGAALTISAAAAAAAVAIFDAATLLAGVPAAVLTWIAVCFSVPFVPHSWLIYPEMPAALIVALAVVWLLAPLPHSPWTWFFRGLPLAVLPWLHTKFAVLLALLTLFLVARLWRRRSTEQGMPAADKSSLLDCVALLGPIAISGAAWLFSFYRMYGVLDPEAPYGSYTDTHVLLQNIPRGTLGLLFDQKFGLIVYAPVYVLVVIGGWLLLRDRARRVVGVELLTAAAVFVATTTRLYMWWGGASAPARFLVPTIPLLAPAIAVAIGRMRTAFGRVAAATALSVGVGVAAFGLQAPARLFSAPHGYSSILSAFQNGAPLVESLPTFTEENWHAPLGLLAIWLAAAVVAIAFSRFINRRRLIGAAGAALTGLYVFVAVGAAAAGWRTIPARERMAVAQQGAVALADAYDPARVRAVDYARGRRLIDSELLALSTIVADRSLAPSPTSRPLDGPFVLPPGRYEARVWMDSPLSGEGDAVVTVGRDVRLARAPLARNPTALEFELPVPAAVSVGVGSSALARDLRRVDIVPASLVPRSERLRLDVRATGPVDGDRKGFAAYLDDRTRPEGPTFWTHGTDPSSVAIVSGGAPILRLTLRGAPAASRVDLDVGGDRRQIDLGPDEICVLDFPIAAGQDVIPLRVASSKAFRPVDVDATSTDARVLGCQVRLELR